MSQDKRMWSRRSRQPGLALGDPFGSEPRIGAQYRHYRQAQGKTCFPICFFPMGPSTTGCWVCGLQGSLLSLGRSRKNWPMWRWVFFPQVQCCKHLFKKYYRGKRWIQKTESYTETKRIGPKNKKRHYRRSRREDRKNYLHIIYKRASLQECNSKV